MATIRIAALATLTLLGFSIADAAVNAAHARACEAYQRPGYGGGRATLEPGGTSSRSRLDNKISSFKIANGCYAETFTGENFSGQRRTWQGHVHYVGDRWNDAITSWRCECGTRASSGRPRVRFD
jgi:hypothetical protein